jgi:hypothetical protein
MCRFSGLKLLFAVFLSFFLSLFIALPLMPCGGKGFCDQADPDWWDPDGVSSGSDWHYRIPVEVSSSTGANPLRVPVDFNAALAALGVDGDFDPDSVRVIRPGGIPAQRQLFDDGSFEGAPDAEGNARGDVIFNLEDPAPVTYHIYFDILQNGPKPAADYDSPCSFFDDFDDGDADGWKEVRGNTWDVRGGKYWVGPGGGEHRSFNGDTSWDDYQVSVKAELFQGNGYGVYFRATNFNAVNGYIFQYDPGYGGGAFIFRKIVHGRERPPFAGVRVEDTAFGASFEWYDVERKITVVVSGDTFSAYVDDIWVLSGTDSTYTHGAIGLRKWSNSIVSFDDVKVVDAVVTDHGSPQGFGADITSISNQSDPGGAFLCGHTVGVTVQADVGLCLDNGSGRTYEARFYDSDGNPVNGFAGGNKILLYDDGTHGDPQGQDGEFNNLCDFVIPDAAGLQGGSWRVEVRPGDGDTVPACDNGYGTAGVDVEFFTVEGMSVSPATQVLAGERGDSPSTTFEIQNMGSAELDDVKAEMTVTLDDGSGHTIPDGNVSFSPASVSVPVFGSADMDVQVDIPMPPPPVYDGVYNGRFRLWQDADHDGVWDGPGTECIVAESDLVVTVYPASSGMITPQGLTSLRKAGQPSYYVYDFVNLDPSHSDRGNLTALRLGGEEWTVEVYRDLNNDDPLGAATPDPDSTWSPGADDVLLCRDDNGDGTWDYVNPLYDTGSDGIPDTGELAPAPGPGNTQRIVMKITPASTAVEGLTSTTELKGSSNYDWITNHPGLPYNDDAIFHDQTVAVTETARTYQGMISPPETEPGGGGTLEGSGNPGFPAYFAHKFTNLSNDVAQANLSVFPGHAGWTYEVYKSKGADGELGARPPGSVLDSDDVILARDSDGDGVWDYVNEEEDTEPPGVPGHGIPDTGPIPPSGGYVVIIYAVIPPEGTAPDVVDTTKFRGSSQDDWVNNHPDLPYNDDAVYHCDVYEELTVLRYDDYDINPVVQYGQSSPGRSADYVFEVRNTGNSTGGFDFNIEGLPGGWSSDVSPESCNLSPGESRDVIVSVTPSLDAAIGDTATVSLMVEVDGATVSPLRGVMEHGVTESQLVNSWYFAEGCTAEGFHEYLCLENMQDVDGEAEITYMFGDGSSQVQEIALPARSRTTVDVNAVVGQGKDVAARVVSDIPIVAERPMYFHYGDGLEGGHVCRGAPSPSRTWYFAEGYTGEGFDEYICVVNPGDDDARLTFNFQTEEGWEKVVPDYIIAAGTRMTFKVDDLMGEGYQNSLELVSSRPVVAERVMYFDYAGTTGDLGWRGGHCVMGVPSLLNEYYFAEGTTRTGFEAWITLQNPHDVPITVEASYYPGPGQGDTVTSTYRIPAKTRRTVYLPAEVGPGKDVSVKLTSSSQFLAERPTYFHYTHRGKGFTGGHCVSGATYASFEWLFAEGYTGNGNDFDQWICLQNPNAVDARVEITYYTQESGVLPVQELQVPAESRLTFLVNDVVGSDLQLSCRIVSDQPVVAERPMYFNYFGLCGGHDAVGYTP